MFKKIVKRDGKIVDFNPDKISRALEQAATSTHEYNTEEVKALVEKVIAYATENIKSRIPSVEQVQDAVEDVLNAEGYRFTAKKYADYRRHRSDVRISKSDLMGVYKTIAIADASEDSDVKRGNANVDGNSPMGKMLQFGAEGSKVFAKTTLMRPEYAYAHDK